MGQTTFSTTVLGMGNNTGLEVPDAALAELGAGRRAPVVVTVAGYTYRSTVAVMGGKNLISLSKAHREASGLAAGDAVEVTLVLDDGPREVEVPDALQAALEQAGLTEAFAALSYSRRKEHARQVAEAKGDDTRSRRVAKVLTDLS